MLKRVEVTYEITRRVSEAYWVNEKEYQDIHDGELPERLAHNLEDAIDNLDGDREDDWAAVDLETGKQLQDWRG